MNIEQRPVEKLRQLIQMVINVADAEDWEKTLTDGVEDVPRVDLMEFVDYLTGPAEEREYGTRPMRCPYFGCSSWDDAPFPGEREMLQHLHDAHGAQFQP